MGPGGLLLGLGVLGGGALALANRKTDRGIEGPGRRTAGMGRPAGMSDAGWAAVLQSGQRPPGISDDAWAAVQEGRGSGLDGRWDAADPVFGSAPTYGGIGDWFRSRAEDTRVGWEYMQTVYREDGAAAVASESASAGGYAAQQAVAGGAAYATDKANEGLDRALAAVDRMAQAREEWEAAVSQLGPFEQMEERSGIIPKIIELGSGFVGSQIRSALVSARSLGGSWAARANKISDDLQRAQFSGAEAQFGLVIAAVPAGTAASIIAGTTALTGIAAAVSYIYGKRTDRILLEQGLEPPTDWPEAIKKAAPWVGGAVIVTGLLYKALPALQDWKGQGNYDYDYGPRTDYTDW
jgi:hypothetical protein